MLKIICDHSFNLFQIERIREENRRILAEEIRKQEERRKFCLMYSFVIHLKILFVERKKAQVQPAHLKVKWNKVQSDSSSEVYNVDSLRKIFSKVEFDYYVCYYL